MPEDPCPWTKTPPPGFRDAHVAPEGTADDDKVNPAHYKALGEYSALHVVEKWGLGFCLGNALKYIQRAGTKAGESDVVDLKKAVWYMQREIHQRDRSEPDPADRG